MSEEEVRELRDQLHVLGRMFTRHVELQPAVGSESWRVRIRESWLRATCPDLKNALHAHPSLVGCNLRLLEPTEFGSHVFVELPPYGVKPSAAAEKALKQFYADEFQRRVVLAEEMLGTSLDLSPGWFEIRFEFVSPASRHKPVGRKKK